MVVLAVLGLTSFAAAESTELHAGTWTKVSHEAEGTWRIVEEDGERRIELSEAFKTRSAPDLKLFLSPKPLDDLTGENAKDGAHRIAQLTSNEGAQTYRIDASVDLSAYRTVIIHCERYSKLWAGSALEGAAG